MSEEKPIQYRDEMTKAFSTLLQINAVSHGTAAYKNPFDPEAICIDAYREGFANVSLELEHYRHDNLAISEDKDRDICRIFHAAGLPAEYCPPPGSPCRNVIFFYQISDTLETVEKVQQAVRITAELEIARHPDDAPKIEAILGCLEPRMAEYIKQKRLVKGEVQETAR